MSSKRGSDKKTEIEKAPDSGYLSGPISEELLSDSGVISEQLSSLTVSDSDNKEVLSASSYQHDSGLCMSSGIVSDQVKTQTQTQSSASKVSSVKFDPKELIPFLLKQDEDGDTQLHIAAVHGCQRTVTALLRICPDKSWIDLPNDCRHTALHLAVMSKNAMVARMLLIAGASLEARDLAGQTPLHIATELQNIQCLHALLTPVNKTAKDKKTCNPVLNETNYDGQTCVHIAAGMGNIEVLKTLLYYGADINAKEHHAGWTALHVAARRGDLRLTRFLLGCAGVVSRARDYAQRTPRRLARRTPAAPAFAALPAHSDDDSDSDDDDVESDSEDLFESLLKQQTQMLPVA